MSVYYTKRLNDLDQVIEVEEKKSQKFSWLRLLVILMGAVLTYLASQFTIEAVIGVLLVTLLLFILIVRVHGKQQVGLNYTKIKRKIAKNELDVAEGGENFYDDGVEYQESALLFGHDLDVFGKHSLFHFINRTSTYWGKSKLSSFFSEETFSTPKEEIKKRQEAVKELADKQGFSEDLKLYLYDDTKNQNTHQFKINSSFLKNFSFNSEKRLSAYLVAVPFIWIAVLIGFVLGSSWASPLALVTIIINFSIMNNVGGQVGSFMRNLDSTSHSLDRLANAIKLISDETFESELIKEKVSDISGGDFYTPLLKLSNSIQQLDIRKNMMGLVILYTIIPFDILVIYKIRKWFVKYPDLFDRLFDIIGNLEAYNSLAVTCRNNPSWDMPLLSTDSSFIIKGEEIGHPLIFSGANGHEDGGVRNTYTLDSSNRISIVTGSNMSGKSTFLRVIGVNLLLAYAGSVVCATKFEVGKRVKLITSMRIADSLRLSESTFKAELERIKLIIESIDKNEDCLFLVDEMLRGTNSVDKLKGSFALLEKLKDASGANIIVATHDLQLSDFENNGHQNFTSNYHFDFDYSHNEFDFDYKLKDGVCQKFNASLLLNELGLKTN
ncbi:hypothetical protein EI427_09300 [Flammeovirga pectinis]|uniref:DNA mismatch repair proteins mutS family domain-containing protein n=1 Tax=Flammeovirga pectinis TaxID=2494373 RepID=A0A3S9P2M6_9BACT|nr:hypothetical protein [Flammeovirga pectinis]AZQ62425.1 hypothetical protein EI427_09300 [Flammeovirga pectinis]